MQEIENVRTIFPDRFGIKNVLRGGVLKNPEFLELTLKSYQILQMLKDQKLSISDSLKANKNVSIFDHQILAAQKVKNEMGGSAILADEVGLGKTVEAGIIIKEFLVTGLASNVLILTPPSIMQQWRDEMLGKFDLDFAMYRNDSHYDGAMSHDLLLMSHSSAVYPKQSALLNAAYWDLVVVDEAHSMKNSETYKHQLVRDLPKRNLLLLTATPVQNNLREMYNLVDLLRPGHLGTWKQFSDTYVADGRAVNIHRSMHDRLQEVLSAFIIRTTRNEVRRYIKFTDRIPNTDILGPTHDESKLYDAITEIVRNMYRQGGDTLALMIYQRLASSSTESSKRALYKMKVNNTITDVRYQELMSVANGISQDSKLACLLDIMRGHTSKFLIFTEFYATQDYITENLRKSGYSVTLFNGKMNREERSESVDRFKGDIQVMVSTAAGGEGHNFQFCHNIVNYDLPWNPMRVEQRVGRVHRIGQKNDVNIFSFALKGTIEAYILELLYAKINLFKMTLGDMDVLFEDSWSGGSPRTWFKEYMEAETENDRRNRFSAMGDDWKSRKEDIHDAVMDFNSDVFRNFDLSAIRKDDSS